jgi:microcystin-dependent protein
MFKFRVVGIPLLLGSAVVFLLHYPHSAAAQILGVPKGAIMAFRLQTCPSGWQPAVDLAGRTIVGAGAGQDDQNGKPLTKRTLGQTGGEEMHKLTIAEMPSHSHGVQQAAGIDGNRSGQQDALYHAVHGQTDSVGGDQPHNIMPPYLVLTYCEKK